MLSKLNICLYSFNCLYLEQKSVAGTSTSDVCMLVNVKDLKKINGSSFWVEGWRQKLCTCASCDVR